MTISDAKAVVCATDLSDSAAEALDSAFGLPPSQGPRTIHVLYVRDAHDRIESAEIIAARAEEEEEALRLHVHAQVERFKQRTGAAPTSEIAREIRHGKPVREILRFALDVNADLIIVGTHGRTGLRHALLGSVAEQIVYRAPCSVLVAKTKSVRDHLAELAAKKTD
jgi:nucleotide-binding universal stress UspA family protein